MFKIRLYNHQDFYVVINLIIFSQNFKIYIYADNCHATTLILEMA